MRVVAEGGGDVAVAEAALGFQQLAVVETGTRLEVQTLPAARLGAGQTKLEEGPMFEVCRMPLWERYWGGVIRRGSRSSGSGDLGGVGVPVTSGGGDPVDGGGGVQVE